MMIQCKTYTLPKMEVLFYRYILKLTDNQKNYTNRSQNTLTFFWFFVNEYGIFLNLYITFKMQ